MSSPLSAVKRLTTHFNHISRQASSSSKMAASEYTVRQVGAPNTLDYRVFIEKDGKVVSPFQ